VLKEGGGRPPRGPQTTPPLRGTPPEGGELGRCRDFSRGRRDGVGEGMVLSGSRNGLGQSDFLDNNDLSRTVRSRTIGSHGKIGRPGQEQSTCSIGPPLNPLLLGGGRGWSRTASTNRESIPGKKTATPCTYPRQNPRNPASEIYYSAPIS